MKIKILAIIWIVLNCLSSNAQELITKFPLIKDGRNVIDVNYAHFIPKTDKNSMQLFIIDDYNIGAVELDDSFNVLSTISTEQRKKKFLNFSSGYANNKLSYLYFTGRSDDKFNLGTFDFINKNFQLQPLNLRLKNEAKLGTFTFGNSFLLLTIVRKSSLLKLYTISGDKVIETKEFDLGKYDNELKGSNSLYGYLTSGFYNLAKGFYKNTVKIRNISSENPNSLESTSFVNKLYQEDDKIILTIDKEPSKTIVIEIPVVKTNFSFKVYPKNNALCEKYSYTWRNTNSLLYKDKLFQIFDCQFQLGVRIFDYNSGTLLKAYDVFPYKEISFKNSPLKQEGGKTIFAIGKNKEFEDVGKFLRKVETVNAAIAIRHYGEKIELTIGGYEEIKTSAPMVAFGSFSMGTGFYTPMLLDYYSYSISKEVSFKSILDVNTLEHVKDSVTLNPFDRIKSFSDEVKKAAYKDFTMPVKWETIFKIGKEDYYYGYLRNYNEYFIYRFSEEN